MTRRARWALGWALAFSSLLAAAPAAAQTQDPGKPPFDVRDGQPVRPNGPATQAGVQARARLGAQLGRQAVVDVDPRTGTPRMVARLDGFLTGPSSDDPAQIALDYVRSQRDVFGLTDADFDALRLTRRYTDIRGTTHLIWAQTWRGIVAWDNDLRAAVSRDGRLVNVGGSPVAGLETRTSDPGLSAGQALSRALADVDRRGLAPRAAPRGGPARHTTFTGGHEAELVLFTERRGDVHLAWNVTDRARPGEIYNHLIDAHSGDVLYRANRVKALTGRVNAFEFAPNHPGDAQSLREVEVTSNLDLRGPYAHAYVDEDGNELADGTTPADSGNDWTDLFDNDCTAPDEYCTWSEGPGGIDSNDRRQSAAQAYYLVNNFHDWLRDSEVGFNAASGAFEGADYVRTEVIDSFDLGERDNAFMSTPPDGQSPQMAMFMWTSPNRNGADDATVVYHEYTHGLSNRLVTYSNGEGALNQAQAGAMGEGWSDWYAMDYLAQEFSGLDTSAAGDIAVGEYATGRATGVRRANLDCPVGFNGPRCANSEDTYGDFQGDFSVHNDGEIWAQTLWDLRRAVGGGVARAIVSDGMRLAPPEPSYLDMRNAILLADQNANDGVNRATIWQTFAARGMGFAAYTRDGNDPAPRESFMRPPSGSGLTVTGKVTDAYTGAPIRGALVQLAAPLPGDPTGTTNASGDYAIGGMAAGTYPHVVVTAPGYETVVRSATVGSAGARVDQQLRRNFAAAASGATVVANGPDYTNFGCGPEQLIDNSLTTGWGSTSPNHPDDPSVRGSKSATIALPARIDVAAVRIDPGAVCGDDDSASTANFRVETSADGIDFQPGVEGTFGRDDNHRLNEIGVSRNGVRFVRFTMLTPQRQDFGPPADSGVFYMDAAEFQVIAKRPSPPAAKPDTDPPPPDPTPDLTAPVARLALAAGERLRRSLRRGVRIAVTCDESCSGIFIATLDGRTAKKAKLLNRFSRRKTLKIASGRLALGEGRRAATLKFSRKAKRRLKSRRSLKLTVIGTVTDAAGNSRRVRRTVRLRR